LAWSRRYLCSSASSPRRPPAMATLLQGSGDAHRPAGGGLRGYYCAPLQARSGRDGGRYLAGGPVALRRRLAGGRKRARRCRHLPSRLNYTLRGPAKLVGVSMSWKLRSRLRSSARPPLRLEFLEERIQPGETIGLGLAALFLGDAFDSSIASQRADRGRPSSA